jgi:hypothetical protein
MAKDRANDGISQEIYRLNQVVVELWHLGRCSS